MQSGPGYLGLRVKVGRIGRNGELHRPRLHTHHSYRDATQSGSAHHHRLCPGFQDLIKGASVKKSCLELLGFWRTKRHTQASAWFIPVYSRHPATVSFSSLSINFSIHIHHPFIFSSYTSTSYLFLLPIHPPVIHFFSITSNIHSSPHTSTIHSFLSHTYSPSIHFHNSVISSPLYPPFITSSPSTSTTHHIFSMHIHHSARLLHPHLPITTSSLSTSTTHHLFSIHILHLHPPFITSSPYTSTTHHLSIHIHHSPPLHPHPPLIICSPSTSTTHHLFSIHIPKHAFPSSPVYWLMCELTGVKKLHTTGLLVSPRVLPGTLRPANIQRGS